MSIGPAFVRALRLVAIMVLLAMSAISAPAADFSPIYGNWMEETMGCNPNNDIRRKISRSKIEYHESTCRIVSSRARAKTYTLKLECAGEGESWQRTETFKLVNRRVMTSERLRFIRC